MTIRHGGIKRRKGAWRGKRGEGGRKHTHTHTLAFPGKMNGEKGDFLLFSLDLLNAP